MDQRDVTNAVARYLATWEPVIISTNKIRFGTKVIRVEILENYVHNEKDPHTVWAVDKKFKVKIYSPDGTISSAQLR